MGHLSHQARQGIFWAIIFLGLGGLCAAASTGLCQQAIADRKTDTYPSAADLNSQFKFVSKELETLRADLDWLVSKVKRMEDFGRYVPQKLYQSIGYKKGKIASLEKLKARYMEWIKTAAPREVTGAGAASHDLAGKLTDRIKRGGLADWIAVTVRSGHVEIENRLPILFTSGNSTVAGGYLPFLRKLAEVVKPYTVRISVNGFADTDPIHTQCYPSNFELGAARAAAVVRALVSFGLKPSVFKVSSQGQYPSAAGRASEWKQLRRHADIRIIMTET